MRKLAAATDVFRVTTESPFPYYEAIQGAWRAHIENGNDFTSLLGLPDGSMFEIISLDALRVSHDQGDRRHRSELCSLYIREHQDDFRVQWLTVPEAVRRPGLRLTIDYPEDLVLCRRVYDALHAAGPRIPLDRIVAWLDANPETQALVEPYVA